MKGSLVDLFPLMVIMGLMTFGLVIGSLLYTEFNNEGLLTESAARGMEATFEVFDYGTIFIFIGIGLSIVLAAVAIYTHPIFIIPSIIIIIIIIMIAPIMSNAFMTIATDDALIDETNKYPYTIMAIDSLPYIIGVLALVIFVALFAKTTGGENK